MNKILITCLIGVCLGFSFIGDAYGRTHHAHHGLHRTHHSHGHTAHRHRGNYGNHSSRHSVSSSSLVTIQTAANPITVASHLADKFRGFISDVVARGFKGPVHCFAASGHVPNSRHHVGAACDFSQHGWNRTVSVMYHVGDLASKWGLRDGCTFRSRRDCGHIDDGAGVTGHKHRRHR